MAPEILDAAQEHARCHSRTQGRDGPQSQESTRGSDPDRSAGWNEGGGEQDEALHLTPADLGRLDIKLKFEKDGAIKAHLSVEKPETLAMLQKDAHYLEKTLQQSGFDLDESAISFDLQHKNGQENLDQFAEKNNSNGSRDAGFDKGADVDMLHAVIAAQTHGYITQSGVNITV